MAFVLLLAGTIANLAAMPAMAQEKEPSIDEIAKELANPNTSVASLTLKLQYRNFDGDLEDADQQDSTTLLFQPSLPFNRDDGSKIIWRPAVPFVIDQPLFQGGDDWDEETGMGDISFDLAYAFPAPRDDPGKIMAVGIISSLPTGDEDLGFGEATTLGPEFLYGRVSKELIWGIFPNHQFDIGGEINYYVEQPDAFGPEWMFVFSAAPVVRNGLADWFE